LGWLVGLVNGRPKITKNVQVVQNEDWAETVSQDR
jgi:hypothetical protein